MGAEVFTVYQEGENPDDAFWAAVDQSLYDYGHAGYTGKIAEKDEFTIVRSQPMSRQDANAVANQMIQDDDGRISDKWGPAGAIPVAGENGKTAGWLFFGWASS